MSIKTYFLLAGLVSAFAAGPGYAGPSQPAPAQAASPATPGPTSHKLVPVEAFVKQDEFSTPRISPDGKHIAINARVLRNGRMVPTLTVYSLPDLKVVGAMAMPKEEIPVDFYWITNTRLAVAKGHDKGLLDRPFATGEVVAVDFDGKNFEYLYGFDNLVSSKRGERYGNDEGFGSIESIPGVRNGHFLLGAYLWGSEHSYLYDVDASKALRKLVTEIPAKGLSFHTQRDGTPRFATGRDDKALAVAYKRDDATGNWNKLPHEVVGDEFFPQSFTANDSEFHALFSAKGEPAALIRESLKTGQRTVLAKDDASALQIEWGARGIEPFAVWKGLGKPEIHYLNESSANAKLHKALSAQFPGSKVHFINFTDDGNKLLFGVSSDRDPGSYYLFDKSTGEADILFATAGDIEPELMAERSPFQFKARDGVQLHGFLTLPKDAGNRKLPMIVMPHGGPFSVEDTWYFDPDAQFLANRGYAVLQINFRGSSGRGKNFEASGYKQWGGKIQDDLIDGVKAAIGKGNIDSSRICTFGASFGGYSALMLPIREPGMFKCAVGYAGVYDLAYIYKEYGTVANKSSQAYYAETLGTDEAELAKQSPSKLADQIKVPVWLVHGGKDETAPVEHAKRMRDALIKAGRPPEWTLEPDEGHGFYDSARRKVFYEKLEEFLAKHLGKEG